MYHKKKMANGLFISQGTQTKASGIWRSISKRPLSYISYIKTEAIGKPLEKMVVYCSKRSRGPMCLASPPKRMGEEARIDPGILLCEACHHP